jgi:hypothetical protein
MPNDANPTVANPVTAFAAIPRQARKIEFRTGSKLFPEGGHWQGIQSYYDNHLGKQVFFISRDSDTEAYFLVGAFPPGPKSFGEIHHVQFLPSDGKQPRLRHAGGIQLIGDYLVIGLEDDQEKRRSQIQFWDVSDPFNPGYRDLLTITREGSEPKKKTAGAVGIVQRQHDHLLVVANWDAADLDFYTSNGKRLGDDKCRFSFRFTWSSDTANKGVWEPDRNWGKYQSVNLIADSDHNIFLLGFNTNAHNKDFVDLFALDLSQDTHDRVRKVKNKNMVLKGGAHFRYSGGISIDSSSQLACFATERDIHGKTSVNVSP